jgi:hypothetical protein
MPGALAISVVCLMVELVITYFGGHQAQAKWVMVIFGLCYVI